MNPQDMAAQTSIFLKLVTDYAPPLAGALIVLFAGWTVANWVRTFAARALDKTKIDATLKPVIASTVRYILLGVTVLIVLQQFGVQTASLLAVVGTIGLAIGLALQGTLSNVAAGLMLLFLRPFEVGNHVEAGGAEGTVLGVDLFHTNLRTTDGVDIVIPNGTILSGNIKNMSTFPERIINTIITVPLESDLNKAMAIMKDALVTHPKILHERPLSVLARSLSSGGVEVTLSTWVKNDDYREVRSTILTTIKDRLATQGFKLA